MAPLLLRSWQRIAPAPSPQFIAALLQRFDADLIAATIDDAARVGWPLDDTPQLLGRLKVRAQARLLLAGDSQVVQR